MKSINDYTIFDGSALVYKSKLCSVACSIERDMTPLNGRINELAQSFFNQWLLVVTTYDKLNKSLAELNKKTDATNDKSILSDFTIASINNESNFRDYTYLLILSMKTYLDLFACLVDLVENREIRKEHTLPDISSYGRRYKASPAIAEEFDRLNDKAVYPWIPLLKDIRNRLIHRGYHLKPLFGFKKSGELTVRIHKGTDIYVDIVEIEIGKLFESLMTDMPGIEERISNILLHQAEEGINPLLDVSFKYEGLVSIYEYKET